MPRKKENWEVVKAEERKKHKSWSGISRIERNLNTGEYRFRTHITWKDENGKNHQGETRICKTPEECRREAKRLLKEKTGETETKTPKLYKTIRTIYESEFLPGLRERSERITTEKTTGDINNFRNARSLLNGYMPDYIGNVKIREITSSVFGEWLTYINNTKLSGKSVRRYKTIINIFVRWLSSNGYLIEEDLDVRIRQRLGITSIKSNEEGKRTDRVPPTVEDLLLIIDYYRQEGLEDFTNLSWMVLWVVLFCSGVRVEEVVALRVSSYDPVKNTLLVDDAITDRENPENVWHRFEDDVRHMKNDESDREISIMRFYKGLLDAYLVRYRSYFEMEAGEDGFLFPRLVPGAEHWWQSQKNIGRELDRLKERLNLAQGGNITPQMFRHGCATFLIRDMDLSYDAVFAYFGHASSKMIQDIYATLNRQERQERANTAMAPLLVDSVVVVSPEKQKRQDVMMLKGKYETWMHGLIEEISKAE